MTDKKAYKYPRLVIGGVSSGCCKTTVSIGLIGALRKRNIKVQAYKTGPDYIDSAYLTRSAGKNAYNMDFWLMGKDNTVYTLFEKSSNADISVIEGVMGLMKIVRNHIEEESFKIIDDLMGNPVISPEEKEIRSRITHAAGDTDLYWKVVISKTAIDVSEAALGSKCNIITDSRMAEAGIRKKWLAENGNKYFCAIDREDIFTRSDATGKTRAALSMRVLSEYLPESIVVLGNAPTALFELLSIYKEDEKLKPSLIIGIPVGFVGAADSKNSLSSQSEIPFITLPGTRGGSNLASAVLNALINIFIMRKSAD